MTILDDEAVVAAADLAGRTGASSLEFGHGDDGSWHATAQYREGAITVEGQPAPAAAARALAVRLLAGGKCQHCGGVTTATGAQAGAGWLLTGESWGPGSARQCRWRQIGARWAAGCELDAALARGQLPGPAGAHTKDRLAAALAAVPGIPPGMVEFAANGGYHDYLSPLDLPEVMLHADLTRLAAQPDTPAAARPLLRALAQAVADGKWDATKAESDEWAASPEGRAALRALHPGPDPDPGAAP